jgi:hypothetical protein
VELQRGHALFLPKTLRNLLHYDEVLLADGQVVLAATDALHTRHHSLKNPRPASQVIDNLLQLLQLAAGKVHAFQPLVGDLVTVLNEHLHHRLAEGVRLQEAV